MGSVIPGTKFLAFKVPLKEVTAFANILFCFVEVLFSGIVNCFILTSHCRRPMKPVATMKITNPFRAGVDQRIRYLTRMQTDPVYFTTWAL